MKSLFALPGFENESLNIKARLIYLISLGTIIATLVFAIAIPFVAPALVRRSTILAATIVPACIGVMALVRFSKLRLAGNLLLLMIWLVVTFGSVSAGGTSAPILVGYFIVIIISGLISRRRIRVYATIICLASGIIIAFAESGGRLPIPIPYSPIARVSIYSFFFFIALLLQNITSGNIEQLLRKALESETRFKSLLENIPTITYINSLDLAASTQYVSPQVEKLLGYSQADFVRDPLLWTKILHTEDRQRVLAENALTVETGEPFQLEYRLLSKDDRVIWVRDEAILLHDSEGEPQYWLGVWTDITTRKQAEREQENLIGVMTKHTVQLQAAAEVSNAASSFLDINDLLPNVARLIRDHFNYYFVGIFLVDETKHWAVLRAGTGEMGRQLIALGHRLEVADTSMVGWCIAHRHARIALDVGEDAVRFKNPLLPLTRSEMALPLIVHREIIGAMTIQSELAAAFTQLDVTALQTMADQISNAIENARLFTERNALINELENRNAELERFTYTVSHDLRSPLVTIRGFLGYLHQDATSRDLIRLDKDINRIANAVDKMQTLLNDLLELSRVGRIINSPEDVPFKDIVQETLELISGSLEEGKVTVHLQEDLPVIHGDHVRLVEVMQNLISNAIKFMGNQAEPYIEIGTIDLDRDGKPIFFVRDNGVGIEPQYQEKIFGLFNRLDPTIEGTGIGLTLVRRIIEVHRGQIWVESQPGQGATFLFTLPLASPQQ